MRRPMLLDLFCGAGGAAVGYARAGFDVIGVDTQRDLNFPFTRIVADVFTYRFPQRIDAIHASPPCQRYTTWNNMNLSHANGTWENDNPDYLALVRERLLEYGKPFVIENVCGARYRMRQPVLLHGGHFGLGVYRPRLFEASFPLNAPPKASRPYPAVAVYGANDGRRLSLDSRRDGTYMHVASYDEATRAMGIDWMTWNELREAIPPAYTHYVGRQLLAYV